MDEHRKMAEEIAKWCSSSQLENAIIDALRTTASKSEKDGWNKAINKAVEIIDDRYPSMVDLKHAIRRLIMEEGK